MHFEQSAQIDAIMTDIFERIALKIHQATAMIL